MSFRRATALVCRNPNLLQHSTFQSEHSNEWEFGPIRVRGLFFRSPRFAGPCMPTNHRGDRPLEAIVAQGKSLLVASCSAAIRLSGIASANRLRWRERRFPQRQIEPSDVITGRRGGFQTRPYTKICLDIRCECDKAGAQRQRGR